MKVVIIGGGNMGGALAQGLLEHRIVLHSDLLVIAPREERRKELCERLKVRVEPSVEALDDFDLVVLSVKPQDSRPVCEQLAPLLKPHHLVLSVMAGISLATLDRALSHRAVVRCMPNLPAKIGRSVTVYCAPPALSERQAEIIELVLSSIGIVLRVKDDQLVDAATAISGTGPGYVFYAIEHLLAVAQELGFTEEQAKHLIAETVRGSVDLWEQGNERASTLRARVASKGGTTEAAVREFTNAKAALTIERAVKAAYDRARELAKIFSGE